VPNYYANDKNYNHHHHLLLLLLLLLLHRVAQEALRLRCVRSICCGALLHKKSLNHVMRFYDVVFASNASKFCLLQAVSPSCTHCSNVGLCHTPTLEFHRPPPDGRKRQDIEFSVTEARTVCNIHD
jgi:hypothetical protein